jgi:hypothetical protein
MNKINQILIHVIIPMIIGGMIYIVFRDKNLIMYNWFNKIGILDFIDYLRQLFSNLIISPNWIKFNLPDGIWTYSLTSLMLIIWYKETEKNLFLYLFIPILCFMFELGQLIKMIPGTYDHTDLAFIIIATILPHIFINKNKGHNNE